MLLLNAILNIKYASKRKNEVVVTNEQSVNTPLYQYFLQFPWPYDNVGKTIGIGFIL